ncbi:MAG: TusE/DsrC/DsvC family sulfur relay protein, partial [bacterium]|nr:TusE/DsrC/DsvC family sulfur relay protein [bacterium]
YQQNESVPPVKVLSREMEEKTGCLRWDNKYLEQLYPAGPSRKLCRIAGLPKTAGEIANAAVLGGGVSI